MFKTSQTKTKTWIECRQKYQYKYVEGLRPLVKARPLMFGDIFHQMLEALANGMDPFAVLDSFDIEQMRIFREQKEIYGEILLDARFIMEEYLSYYRKDKLRFIKYNGQRSEHWIELELEPDLLFQMKIDAFARTGNSMRWLVENKTGQIPNDDARWRDLQTSVYQKMLAEHGLKPFDGVLWNYIRSHAPTQPEVNKDGRVSKRAIDTLPNALRHFFKKKGIKVRMDVGAKKLLRDAEENIPSYFKRVYTAAKPVVIESLFSDFVSYSREMRDNHGKLSQKNIGRHCDWCDYEMICRASLTGGDVDAAKEHNYKKAKGQHLKKKKAKSAKATGRVRRRKASVSLRRKQKRS